MEDETTYLEWDFRPYFRVRPMNAQGHFLRENVYVRRWQKLMTRYALEKVHVDAMMAEDEWFINNEPKRYPILDVFDGFSPTAHQTRIASNFILYLGYNRGLSYLIDASNLADKFDNASGGKPLAYLAQWAALNNPADLFAEQGPSPRYAFAQTEQMDMFYSPNYDDLKVLERMAHWCGTPHGQMFINNCERLISRLQERTYPPETAQEKNRRHSIASLIGLTP
jgi:hypothetical protein